MNILDIMRDRIQALYITHPHIHVNIMLKHPHKTRLNNLPVVIKSVYPHMFQVEDVSECTPKLYMHQYTDLVTKDIEILELPEIINQDIKLN